MNLSVGNTKPKVLLVSYDFPPVTSAGMYRIVGMTKYLRRRGWDITVLTVKDTFVHKSAASLGLIPEGVRVVRTGSFELRRVRRSVMARVHPGNAGRGGEGDPTVEEREGIPERMLAFVFDAIDRLFSFPDAKVGWCIPLFLKAWRLLRHERFDVVLSSSPPHSLQLSLLVLRRTMRFKWVTDFRDPWTIPRRGQKASLGFRVRRSMERVVIGSCDHVVANTPGNKEALLHELGRGIEDRVSVVTNGLDVELDGDDVDTGSTTPESDLVYMGELYPGMLDTYARAVRLIKDQGKYRMPKLCIYGRTPGPAIRAVVDDTGVSAWIIHKGRVPYDRSRQIIRDAKALLLLMPHWKGHDTWVPSKLYSYLFSPAPILAIVPQGDAARIVEDTGRGVVVDTETPEDVAAAIVEFLQSVDDGTYAVRTNVQVLEHFRMESVMAKLNEVLGRCMGSNRGPTR